MGIYMEKKCLTFKEAKAIVEMVTYKPGYTFELLELGTCVSMRIAAPPLPDSTNGGKTHIVGVHLTDYSYRTFESPAHLLAFIRDQVSILEAHEMHEWLRFGGKLLYDPHDPGGFANDQLALEGALRVADQLPKLR